MVDDRLLMTEILKGRATMQLDNSTILITGGSSGIGFEFAKQLQKLGNTIIITGRNQKKLDDAKRRLPGIHAIVNDVANPDEVEALVARVTLEFPKLNILINNAGIMRTVNIHKTEPTLKDLTQEIEINLMGPIRLSNRLLPQLKKNPNAAIVNISSGLAFVPLPTSPIYCATKAGLHSFSRSLRVQLKNTSIKVFEVAPPATQTELLGEFDPEDMKGISIMAVETMVAQSIAGMQKDHYEIRPGQSNQLKFMSRFAPEFILKQLSKSVDRMLNA
jgi:uncharacterized oxidoreductase